MCGDSTLLLIIIGSIVGFYFIIFFICWLRLKLHRKHHWVNSGFMPSLSDVRNNRVRQRCKVCGLCRYIIRK